MGPLQASSCRGGGVDKSLPLWGLKLAGSPLRQSISSSAVGWLVTFVPEDEGKGVGQRRAKLLLHSGLWGYGAIGQD